MDLRTESIYHIKQTGQVLAPGEYEPNLKTGGTLIARVEQKEGSSVVLRNDKNGVLIKATVAEGADIESGDTLELSVSKNGSDYLLYIMDIMRGVKNNRQFTRDNLSNVFAALKTNSGLDPKAAVFLAENDVPITQENIEDLKDMVKGGSGIVKLLTDMLADILGGGQQEQEQPEAGLSDTGVSAQTKQAVSSGENIEVKYDVLQSEKEILSAQVEAQGNTDTNEQSIKPELLAGDNAKKSDGPTLTGGAVSQSAVFQDVSETEEKAPTVLPPVTDPIISTEKSDTVANNEISKLSNTNITEEPLPQNHVQEKAEDGVQKLLSSISNGADNSGTAVNTSTSADTEVLIDNYIHTALDGKNIILTPDKEGGQGIQKQSLTDAVWKEIGTVIASAGADKELPEKSIEGLKKLIEIKIQELFIRPDEQTGEEIKNSVMDMPGKLNLLKLLVNHTDSKDKEVFADKMAQTQKQMQLGSEFNRFYYIEVPFMTRNGEQRQAELYIKKNTGGRKKEDPSESVVLISLNTQNIGLIETLIKAKKNSISLEFRLERSELKQEIRKYDKALAESMKETGYVLNGFSVTGLENKTTVLNAGKLFEEKDAPKTGKIDVMI